MRERLTQILMDSSTGKSRSFEALADDILREFRCDKCIMRVKYPGPYSAADYCLNIGKRTKPDFFCAKWEPKA